MNRDNSSGEIEELLASTTASTDFLPPRPFETTDFVALAGFGAGGVLAGGSLGATLAFGLALGATFLTAAFTAFVGLVTTFGFGLGDFVGLDFAFTLADLVAFLAGGFAALFFATVAFLVALGLLFAAVFGLATCFLLTSFLGIPRLSTNHPERVCDRKLEFFLL